MPEITKKITIEPWNDTKKCVFLQADYFPEMCRFFSSVEFLFHGYKIQDARAKEGEHISLSPHATPALRDDDAAPVREVSHRGSHSGIGEKPSGRFAGN
jgi:hypothetical protein